MKECVITPFIIAYPSLFNSLSSQKRLHTDRQTHVPHRMFREQGLRTVPHGNQHREV
jgi:hypothetical protein